MDDWVTTSEAAKELGVVQSRVRQLILGGSLPATKYGRDWLIAASDLDRVRERPKAGRPARAESSHGAKHADKVGGEWK